MNSYSDACMAIVADNIDQIFSSMEKSLQKEMCQPLGFCNEAELKVCAALSEITIHLMICLKDSVEFSFTAFARFCSPIVQWQEIWVQIWKISSVKSYC